MAEKTNAVVMEVQEVVSMPALVIEREYRFVVGEVDPAILPDGTLDQEAMLESIYSALADSEKAKAELLETDVLNGIDLFDGDGVVGWVARFERSKTGIAGA